MVWSANSISKSSRSIVLFLLLLEILTLPLNNKCYETSKISTLGAIAIGCYLSYVIFGLIKLDAFVIGSSFPRESLENMYSSYP